MTKWVILSLIYSICLGATSALAGPKIELPPEALAELTLPSLDPLPEGLPDLIMSADGSLVLPEPWVGPVKQRWLQCDLLAHQAPRALDVSAQIWSAAAQAAISEAEYAVAERDAELASIDVWQPWQVALAGGGAILGALLVGFGAGFVISEVTP